MKKKTSGAAFLLLIIKKETTKFAPPIHVSKQVRGVELDEVVKSFCCWCAAFFLHAFVSSRPVVFVTRRTFLANELNRITF